MTSPSQNPIRILLIDDHQSFVWGMVKLIESDSANMTVIGTAADIAEALVIAQKEQPDIILLDIDLNGVNSLDSLPLLREVTSAVVLILTGVRDPETHDRAVLSGARGVVQKEASAEMILKAIRKVYEGEIWLDRAATGRVFSKLLDQSNSPVSPEATRIASLTLRNHLSSIYGKLEVENRLELAMYAVKHHISEATP